MPTLTMPQQLPSHMQAVPHPSHKHVLHLLHIFSALRRCTNLRSSTMQRPRLPHMPA